MEVDLRIVCSGGRDKFLKVVYFDKKTWYEDY